MTGIIVAVAILQQVVPKHSVTLTEKSLFYTLKVSVIIGIETLIKANFDYRNFDSAS